MFGLPRRRGYAALASWVLVACEGGTPAPSDSGTGSEGAVARDAAPIDRVPAVDANYAFPCSALGDREPTFEPSFEAIYFDIFCHVGCTDGYCHGPRGGWGELTMATIEGAYAALVDHPAGTSVPVDGRPTCRESALLRVDPGAPERSLLYLKVTGEAPCGEPMPPPDSGRRALTAKEQAQVREWIERGAPLRTP